MFTEALDECSKEVSGGDLRLFQGSLKNVPCMFHECFKDRTYQECFNGVRKEISKVIPAGFKVVSWKLQWCVRKVLRVFQGDDSMVFQRRFMDIS